MLRRHARNHGCLKADWTIRFRNKGLTLCHLDLVPRNVLMLGDGKVGLLDWASLAIYPRSFELAGLSYQYRIAPEKERAYFEFLLGRLQGGSRVSEGITRDIQKIEKVQDMSLQYFA